ncbi:phosphoribosylformylglycinamidine synthase subunit PurQ [Alicyclobacillus kakegawensis]|uniref:phosphoribosylformylglycinamidine synthase subunit PurQ n=1 Tax=Alicyclobacillus kakegawensis TaxID=392012 RepID=UPI00083039A9|nr:phosphoribosylformylglycinamidine synthase subunit PurQ [Alicyclobacillus kakegawensis]
MRWAVIVFPGSNCDEDAALAIDRVLGDAVDLVWHDQRDLSAYDAIILPGGFSYGDYLRSGAIARFAPAVAGVREAVQRGALVLGICNGFQVLTEAGLLPGALLVNDHLQFCCELAELQVENTKTPFTLDYAAGERIRIPIAHRDGRYHADAATLTRLRREQRIAFRYVQNPNGSAQDIAGVLGANGRVLGLMPHPERAVAEWMRSADGARMFTSMHRFVEQQGASLAASAEGVGRLG